jgi:GNAT superfamily N-acetyltransferase
MRDIKIIFGWNSDWLQSAIDLIKKHDFRSHDPHKVYLEYLKSFAVGSAWFEDRLIGLGRVTSDGGMYSGIYDVLVDPEFRGFGTGTYLIEALLDKAPGVCVYLTSENGTEPFYYRLKE